MFDHLSTYATDFEATKKFYDGALAALGYSVQMEFVAGWNTDFPTQRLCAYGTEGQAAFWVIEVKEQYTPRHLAFAAENRIAVNTFHQAAITAGGTDNGRPGLRPLYHEHYYGAFVLDPDGNNIEAVCHLADG